MELWNKLAGMVTLELTAANPEQVINRLNAAQIPLWQVRRCSDLTIQLQIARTDRKRVLALAEKSGAGVKLLGLDGIFYAMGRWLRRPLVVVWLVLLTGLTMVLPERVLFVQVQGNSQVPSRLILEAAAQQGLKFGADRRKVRSEQLKNELLGAVEQLQWVGVNTQGCRAIITVRERQPEPEEREPVCGSLVSAADGIVQEVYLRRGTLLCKPGQAVRAGERLVSGLVELGDTARMTQAQAEIYALTSREIQALCNTRLAQRDTVTGEKVRIALIFGKKRINFYSDSGNLPATCDKITQEIPLRLPGGDTLPVVLVLERILWYDTSNGIRTEEQATQLLQAAAQMQLGQQTVAAVILDSRTTLQSLDAVAALTGRYTCREMIARPGAWDQLEGDTKR